MPRCFCAIVLGLVCVSACADDKNVATKTYDLRVVIFETTYHGIRFKPATGESWRVLNNVWEKLEEVAAPPAGDYEITIIPAEALMAVRVDRTTGATWLLRKGKWNPVKEPPADPKGPKPPGTGFAMRHVIVGDQLHVVRFHTKTGTTWHLKGDAFEPLAEFDTPPAGDFELTLLANKKDWLGFRIDRKAGTTWILQANIWQPVVGPE